MVESSSELPCPGCGFLIFGPDAYGSYGICPLCNWEDDPVQLANPLSPGGANGESLHTCQRRSLHKWPLAVREVELQGQTYRRDSAWRPLTDEETAFYMSRDDVNAVFSLDECYWIKPQTPREPEL